MHVLLLEGDRATQQREVCDLLLNHPSGGALTYRAISNKVMLAALYVDTMRSLDPVDGRKGVIREWDLGFWTAVHGGPTHDKRQWKFGWVPSFLFPAWMQGVTKAIPARWAMDGLDAMTWRGLGFEEAVLPIAVLLGSAAIFGALAVWRFRWEAE